MTSSAKLEVDNIFRCRQRRTEPGNTYGKFGEILTCDFLRYAGGQTNRNTDKQTHRHADRNTSHPYRGRSITMHLPSTWPAFSVLESPSPLDRVSGIVGGGRAEKKQRAFLEFVSHKYRLYVLCAFYTLFGFALPATEASESQLLWTSRESILLANIVWGSYSCYFAHSQSKGGG